MTQNQLAALASQLNGKAFENRLGLFGRCWPPFANHLVLKSLRVGEALLKLRFERGSDGFSGMSWEFMAGLIEVRDEETDELNQAAQVCALIPARLKRR